MANLYVLTARYQQLLNQLELSADECAEIEAMHDNLEDACISRGKHILNLEAEAKMVLDAITMMQFRATVLKETALSNRQKLAEIMIENNMMLITKSPLFPLKAKINPISVDDYDHGQIPRKFWRIKEKTTVTESVDKIAIKLAIESGEDVPGALLTRSIKVDFK